MINMTPELTVKFEEIVAISKSIDNLYNLLCYFELNNDDVQYQQHLIYLDIALEAEKAKYDRLSHFEIDSISGHIIEHGLTNSNLVLVSLGRMMNDDTTNNRFYSRIMNKIHQNKITGLDIDMFSNNFLLSEQAQVDLNENIGILNYYITMTVNESIDCLLTILNNSKNDNLPFCLKLKYALAYLDNRTEQKLFQSEFNLTSVINSELLINTQTNDYLIYKGSMLYSQAMAHIMGLLTIDNGTFLDEEFNEPLLFNKLLLKMSLTLSKLEAVEELEVFFQKKAVGTDGDLAITYIQDIFDSVKKEKQLDMQRNKK